MIAPISIRFRLPSCLRRCLVGLCLGLLLAVVMPGRVVAQAPSVTGFEARHTHPVDLTPDGTRLLAVHSEAAILSVFDVSGGPAMPVRLGQVPVGLEPVSVRTRTNNEAWVVSEVSDTVTIVLLDGGVGTVAGVLPTGDEPSDVVFAAGKAFVSCARDHEIWVYDVATGDLLDQIAVEGLSPSALAVSPDGNRVFAAFLLSGNGTTVLPRDLASAPGSPTNGNLPPAPQTTQIVPASDARITYTVVDHDIAEIDTVTHSVVRYVGSVGTNLMGLAVRPDGSSLWASHTEAQNLIATEPALNGRFALSRLGVIDTTSGVVGTHDLNPGVDLDLLPNPAAQATALSQPTAMVFEPGGDHLWVAAFASDRVARVAAADGSVVERVDVRIGGSGDADEMRGPRGLAWQAATGRLYVLNKISQTLSVIDTLAPVPAVVAETPLSEYEPLPPAVKAGRGYLFDARLSGNGLVSCGICHLDADRDGLAWDLGDPAGDLQTVLGANLSIHDTTPRTRVMHPMKGPMTTQTLRGMQTGAPFHWRGDRATIADFNPTFPNLLGGEPIEAGDMENLTTYLMTLRHHPNPHRNLDRTLPASFGSGNPTRGRDLFNDHLKSHCITCHALPTGSDNNIDLPQEAGLSQPVKSPPLRTVYQRLFLNPQPGAVSLSGFGLLHDGTGFELPIVHPYVLDNLSTLQELRDVSAFMMCFDTGTAPTVGLTRLAGVWNRTDAGLLDGIALLEARAATTDCELVVRGVRQGVTRAWHYDKASQSYRSDRVEEGLVVRATLLNEISGAETLAFMGVFPGQGQAMGGDADLDGVRDGNDPSLATYDGAPRIVSPPRSQAAPPGGTVTLRVAFQGGSATVAWYRNGILLDGETGAELVLDALVSGDAGNYHATVTNSLGTATSSVARVDVYAAPTIKTPPVPRAVIEGRITFLAVAATGSALAYQWYRNGKAVAGATAAVLMFPGAQGADDGDYSVAVSNGAGSVNSTPVRLTVIQRPVIATPVTLPAAIVGQAYLAPLTAANGPTRFTVVGLPKGLYVPKGRLEIAGRALVSGVFPVRITAYNAAGSSGVAVTANLEVKPFPVAATGIYEGSLPRHPALNDGLGGHVMVNTSGLSVFSGVLRLGRGGWRLRGQWTVTETEGPKVTLPLPRKGLPPLSLVLEIDVNTRTLSGRVEDGTESCPVTGGKAIADPLPFAGNHNVALLVPLASEGDPAVPQGDGFGGFVVTPKGVAVGAMTLADGSLVRFAGMVTEGGRVHLFQPLYRGWGSLLGQLTLVPGGGHRLAGSALSWRKDIQPLPGRLYPGGHGTLDLRVLGGLHVIPAKGETIVGLGRAGLAFTEGGAPDPATRLDVAEIVFPALNPSRGTIAGANPGYVGVAMLPGAGIKFAPGVTGLFAGSFALLDPDTTVLGNPVQLRKAAFRGMIVDDGSGPRGYGHFLLPKMPETGPPATTLRTSPFLSGRVRLNPLP